MNIFPWRRRRLVAQAGLEQMRGETGGGIAGTAVTGVLAGTGGVGVGVEDELMIRSASHFVYMVSIVPVARASAARDRLN